jgi:hypothetical protein
MSSNYMQSAFPDESEFQDATDGTQRRRSSIMSATLGLDDFEFDLEDCDERLLADSRGSDIDMLMCLANSRGSAGIEIDAMMDVQFESLTGSLNTMHVDQEEADRLCPLTDYKPQGQRRRRGQRERSPSPDSKRAFRGNINFDPPTTAGGGHHQRHYSCSDISSCAAAPSTSEQLQRLAESMKRTEESRNHVMMQRKMLTPTQQEALATAKEQLQKQQQQQQQPQGGAPEGSSSSSNSSRSVSPGRSSIMAAFFSGSRGTLTTGLEQSRRELGMYMGQLNRSL